MKAGETPHTYPKRFLLVHPTIDKNKNMIQVVLVNIQDDHSLDVSKDLEGILGKADSLQLSHDLQQALGVELTPVQAAKHRSNLQQRRLTLTLAVVAYLVLFVVIIVFVAPLKGNDDSKQQQNVGKLPGPLVFVMAGQPLRRYQNRLSADVVSYQNRRQALATPIFQAATRQHNNSSNKFQPVFVYRNTGTDEYMEVMIHTADTTTDSEKKAAPAICSDYQEMV